MGSHRRCCCGAGIFNCEECYFVDNPDYNCSECADTDTATVELDVSFTPYQWGCVEDYTNCAFFQGPNAGVVVNYCTGCQPNQPPYARDENYGCYDCSGSIRDTGVPATRNCCINDDCLPGCPDAPAQCQCVIYDESTDPSIKFLCNRFLYRIFLFTNPSSMNCASVSCGFKPLRYTYPDVIYRKVPGPGLGEPECPGQPGTIQYFPEITTEISRKCVFKRKRGYICGPGNQEEPFEFGTCGHVAIEDIGGGPRSSQVENNQEPGNPDNIEYAKYIHCTKILQSDPETITCPTASGIFISNDFFQYLNPDGNYNRRFSIIRITTSFPHIRPKVEEFTVSNVPCCTSLSSVINQADTEEKIHAVGILYYYRELPECSISNRNDFCFNRGVYNLGYVKFGYPKQFTEFEGKAWFQSNPFSTTTDQLSYNIGQRLYYTCDGDNIPGDIEGIPTLPTLRTDFSYPEQITLV
jgi:hypothetical protein